MRVDNRGGRRVWALTAVLVSACAGDSGGDGTDVDSDSGDSGASARPPPPLRARTPGWG